MGNVNKTATAAAAGESKKIATNRSDTQKQQNKEHVYNLSTIILFAFFVACFESIVVILIERINNILGRDILGHFIRDRSLISYV